MIVTKNSPLEHQQTMYLAWKLGATLQFKFSDRQGKRHGWHDHKPFIDIGEEQEGAYIASSLKTGIEEINLPKEDYEFRIKPKED